MDRAQTREEYRDSGPSCLTVEIPQRTLVVLCGSAGSGKSTFAHNLIARHKNQGLKPTVIVSSDQCRAMISDDEANQFVNRDTFDLFHFIIHKRMFQDRFTIADSTALQVEARQRLLALAQRHHYHTCLFIFNIPPALCIQRDQQRQRLVGEQVIAYHTNLLQQALLDAPKENWNQLHILDEHTKVELAFLPN
ncbi:AAA family ATPase [Ktedonosporobacter rubrisoli]|nr:AAA family ATPase [Ktedonosporobacter rubrisoli]